MPQDPHSERFEQLIREHGAGLDRVLTSYARSRAEVDDLRQELALGLWRALPSFRGECSERTFVFRIAHNLGQTHSFKQRRLSTEPPPDQVDPTDAPDEQLGALQRRTLLLRAIRALPLSHREVLTLALEELSHAEIGEVLGITANNVGVRLNRARAALREKLEETRP